ncbi:MAG TPA: hypothetical protein VLD84_01070 [Nitrososphaeraceae archaeon]|nr:hypothetical protein [Nitrososphaeraceae archaeon]
MEKIDDIYKIIVYKGDREEYSTFCTPECAKEIDLYLEYRKRRGENITDDSYLIVKKFSVQIRFKSKPLNHRSLQAILEYNIKNNGNRELDYINKFKRKAVTILHGFRKFFTTQFSAFCIDNRTQILKALIYSLNPRQSHSLQYLSPSLSVKWFALR